MPEIPQAQPSGVSDALDAQNGIGQGSAGISLSTFVASLAAALAVFAAEFFLFLFLKGKLTRIYQPRTYLVPERERTNPSPAGLFRWIGPVFRTSNSEFIQKCGLDAFFFLRYLRTLLKIFIPLSFVILPVLIPLNSAGGKDTGPVSTQNGTHYNVTGLDQLSWGNVRPGNADRYWGHLVLAVVVVIYVCAVFFDELRGYVRLRQSYLSSPQHRLRASATTVLVTAIPEKWLTVDALYRLFDVFPGGVRNIWLNRNLDQLNEKVKLRNQVALALESAETELIKMCKKAQLKTARKQSRKSGKHFSKDDVAREKTAAEKKSAQLVDSAGVSAGDPHQTPHTVHAAVHGHEDDDDQGTDQRAPERDGGQRSAMLASTVGAVGLGVTKLKKSVLGPAKKFAKGADDSQTPGGRQAVPAQRHDSGDQAPDDHAVAISGESGDREGGLSAASGQREAARGVEYRTATDQRGPAIVSMDGASDAPTVQTPTIHEHHGQASMTAPWGQHGDQSPLANVTPVSTRHDARGEKVEPPAERGWVSKVKRACTGTDDRVEIVEYPVAFNEDFEEDDYGEPVWMKYVREKDRETIRLPIFGWDWMPSLPLLGKKVDKIYHCREELARLNLEIEIDQQHPERFPLMNSAFVQFNHQVAAHMACQCVSHHLPKQMAPRIIEISPDDVIWDNMSIRWWERYLRTFGVIAIVAAMVVGWAFPVAFTGLLAQLSYLQAHFSWLRWLETLPDWLISAVQGILPPLFLSILMALLPLILRFLSRSQGVHTGMSMELTVQNYYFAFLFVQIFLVVSISSGFSTIFNSITEVTSVPSLLAQNIPKASNYFFSYMVLQAMSVSAGALVQIFGLVSWFILAPILDSTARMKWARTTNLNQMQWGTFFPVYTTLASIGLIYCVISPLIMVFNVLTFGLFWFVYRYNTLYVTKFRFDTGGLLFPKAINQLFTGIYVMEICLIGMFFLVRDEDGDVACEGQAICMIVVLGLTLLFQYLLNEAFNPLIRYLPVTLEDEATQRDEEFARAQRRRLGLGEDESEDEDNASQRQVDARSESIKLNEIRGKKKGNSSRHAADSTGRPGGADRRSWADRSANRRSAYFGASSHATIPTVKRIRQNLAEDSEAQASQTKAIGQALFSGIHDELEDLTPDERDRLVQRAFQHEALRARRPVIWIPRDDLGVSDDEIFRTQRYSKHIWISNEYQALDGKCRAIFSRSPPDFSEVDLIQL